MFSHVIIKSIMQFFRKKCYETCKHVSRILRKFPIFVIVIHVGQRYVQKNLIQF